MSSNILTVRLALCGTRPLLWHAFTADTIPASGKRERTGVAGNDPCEWRRTVLVTAEGRLYLEPSYLFGCLRDGARHTRRGRGTLQPAVAATLQVADERVLVDRYLPDPLTSDPAQQVYLDVRSVKNPATKARNVRYRVAASPGWSAECNISFDPTLVSRSEMEAVAHDAGRFTGLGDGRQIGCGRFEVTSFEVTVEEETGAAKDVYEAKDVYRAEETSEAGRGSDHAATATAA